MPLSPAYLAKLNTCDPRLIRVVLEVAKTFPLIVVCGHRDKDAQNDAYNRGRSKVRWPNSRHNSSPSQAVDLAPSPLDWDDEHAFRKLADAMKAEAKRQGLAITWGGDWPGAWDQPHFEITRKTAA